MFFRNLKNRRRVLDAKVAEDVLDGEHVRCPQYFQQRSTLVKKSFALFANDYHEVVADLLRLCIKFR